MLNILLPNKVRTGLVYVQMFNAIALAVFALVFWICIMFNKDNFSSMFNQFKFWHFIYIICNIINVACILFNIFVCIISFTNIDLFNDIIVWCYFGINTLLSVAIFLVIMFRMYEYQPEIQFYEEAYTPLLDEENKQLVKKNYHSIEDNNNVSEGISGALYSLILYLLSFALFCNIFVSVVYLFKNDKAWWISLICLAPMILGLLFGDFLSSKILFVVFIILLTLGLFLISSVLDVDSLVWLFHKHII